MPVKLATELVEIPRIVVVVRCSGIYISSAFGVDCGRRWGDCSSKTQRLVGHGKKLHCRRKLLKS
jgi:hypothetical protein